MKRLCIIPAKPLVRAKARLATEFSAEDRRILVVAMLSDVVAAARFHADVWVVCSDPETAAAASAIGARAQPDETPDAGLNSSLDAAARAAEREGHFGALVLASDLPCATPEAILDAFSAAPVAVAPSRDGTGTNALWRSPPLAIPAAFGPESRIAHQRAAQSAGLTFHLIENPRLALDVDTPDDLRAAVAEGAGPETQRALVELGWSPATTSHT